MLNDPFSTFLFKNGCLAHTWAVSHLLLKTTKSSCSATWLLLMAQRYITIWNSNEPIKKEILHVLFYGPPSRNRALHSMGWPELITADHSLLPCLDCPRADLCPRLGSFGPKSPRLHGSGSRHRWVEMCESLWRTFGYVVGQQILLVVVALWGRKRVARGQRMP